MILILRLLICAGAAALAGYILALTYSDWPGPSGMDVNRLLEVRTDLDQELAFGRRLEGERAAVLARAHAKHGMLMDLIEGRLTLLETATRYRDMDQAQGNRQVDRLAEIWPGGCQPERYCHQIIQVAEWELSEQPERAAAAVNRLKSELLALAESGTFCAPE
jgi:hypothetical protein